MMTLALLITAATGAWAESKPIGLNVEYAVGDVITTNSTGEVYIWWGIYSEGGDPEEWVIKISSSVTPTISELRIVESSGSIKLDKDYAVYDMNGNIAANSYSIQCQGKVTGTTLEKVYVASGSGTLTDPYVFAPGPAGPIVTPVPLTWDAATPNTATLTNGMPAGNVTVSVEYFPQAEFAMSTDATPVALAPTAIADVPATTDGPIVNPGTVKNIGTSEVKQGTLMYYVSTTPMTDDDLLALTPDKWSADVPTAESLAEGQAYVYYYIKGAEPATIAERTDANTCSDGDILAANVVNVTLAAAPLWNAEFDLTNAPEEDKAGKWSTDIPEGGVVKGTPVKVTYTGTKKIIGVKAEKKAAEPASTPLDNTTTAWTAGTFAVPAGGLTYSDAITVSGDVTLVLTDGETLTLNKGISLAAGATLTVEGNGTMNVNGTNNSTASTVAGTGMLVLTSGTLNAKGGNGESFYTEDDYNGRSGGTAINGSVTVSGGTLTAIGGNGGEAYSGSEFENSYGGSGGTAITGSVTINSGTLTATGGNGGKLDCAEDCTHYKAGNGGDAIGGSVTENGGTTTFANGSDGSASFGSGCSDCNAGSGGKGHN